MTASAAIALKAQLRADLKIAMRAQRREETQLLRLLIAAVDDAEAVPAPEGGYITRAFEEGSAEVPRRKVTAEMLQAILQHEFDARHAAADAMDRIARADRAGALRFQAAIVARYL